MKARRSGLRKLVRFFDADHVMIMKKTKKGENGKWTLEPFVYELNVRKEWGGSCALYEGVCRQCCKH